MMPRLVDMIPRDRGDGEVWEVGGGYRLLVLPEGEMAHVSGYRARDRAEGDWLTLEIERIARATGLWCETSPSIDITMIVVRRDDAPALIRACADHFDSLGES